MSFLNTAIGTALGGVGGGILANNWNKLNQKSPTPGVALSGPLTAGGVGISQDLKNALSNVGTVPYNNISGNYKTAKSQFANDAAARGLTGSQLGPNTYGGNRFTTQHGLDVGGLESALGGGVANTAYNNALQQRDFGQNELLAEEVANENKPSMLQQVLGGIGSVGGTAASVYGAFGKNRSPGSQFPMGNQSFPQGQSQMNMPLPMPSSYANNPYLNGGGY